MVAIRMTINVVNLIPDAVEALPPPTNIRNIVTNKDESSMSPIEIVLKPAVRGETAWK